LPIGAEVELAIAERQIIAIESEYVLAVRRDLKLYGQPARRIVHDLLWN
jgi:hypothetical protein